MQISSESYLAIFQRKDYSQLHISRSVPKINSLFLGTHRNTQEHNIKEDINKQTLQDKFSSNSMLQP